VEFWKSQVGFLGHVVSKKGILVDPIEIEVVLDRLRPTIVIEVQSFLGLAGYNWRFIEGFAHPASPITKLMWKGVSFD